MNLDNMNEQDIRLQIQNTLNSLAEDANDYQMDLQDIVDHISVTLPLLEYLCKTALNVSHIEKPTSMQDLVKTAEDITLQHLGGALYDEMSARHAALEPVDDFLDSKKGKEEAEQEFQNAYEKSVADSHFEDVEFKPAKKEEFVDDDKFTEETTPEDDGAANEFEKDAMSEDGNAADEVVNDFADDVVNDFADDVVNDFADDVVNDFADDVVNDFADDVADEFTENVSDEFAKEDTTFEDNSENGNVSDDFADDVADEFTENVSDEFAKEDTTFEDNSENGNVSDDFAEDVPDEFTENVADEFTKEDAVSENGNISDDFADDVADEFTEDDAFEDDESMEDLGDDESLNDDDDEPLEDLADDNEKDSNQYGWNLDSGMVNNPKQKKGFFARLFGKKQNQSEASVAEDESIHTDISSEIEREDDYSDEFDDIDNDSENNTSDELSDIPDDDESENNIIDDLDDIPDDDSDDNTDDSNDIPDDDSENNTTDESDDGSEDDNINGSDDVSDDFTEDDTPTDELPEDNATSTASDESLGGLQKAFLELDSSFNPPLICCSNCHRLLFSGAEIPDTNIIVCPNCMSVIEIKN